MPSAVIDITLFNSYKNPEYMIYHCSHFIGEETIQRLNHFPPSHSGSK